MGILGDWFAEHEQHLREASRAAASEFDNADVEAERQLQQQATFDHPETGDEIDHPETGDSEDSSPVLDALDQVAREMLQAAQEIEGQPGRPVPRLFERTGPGVIAPEELVLRFTHHPPKGTQHVAYEAIRQFALRFALFLKQNTPASREQSLAITHLEEVVFWANASIARREVVEVEPNA